MLKLQDIISLLVISIASMTFAPAKAQQATCPGIPDPMACRAQCNQACSKLHSCLPTQPNAGAGVLAGLATKIGQYAASTNDECKAALQAKVTNNCCCDCPPEVENEAQNTESTCDQACKAYIENPACNRRHKSYTGDENAYTTQNCSQKRAAMRECICPPY